MDNPVWVCGQLCDRHFMKILLAIKPKNPFNRQPMMRRDLVTNFLLLNKMDLFTSIVLQNAFHLQRFSLEGKKRFISETHRIVNTVVEHGLLHGSLSRRISLTSEKFCESQIESLNLMTKACYFLLAFKPSVSNDESDITNNDIVTMLHYMSKLFICSLGSNQQCNPRIRSFLNQLVFPGSQVQTSDNESDSTIEPHFPALD